MTDAPMTHPLRSTESPASGDLAPAAAQAQTNAWLPWRYAVANRKPVDVPQGYVAFGYYRARDGECIAFLPDGEGRPYIWRSTDKFCPTQADAIADQFSWVSMNPVSFEDAEFYGLNGHWPEQLATVKIPAALAPDEAAAHELAEQQKAAKAWLLGLKDAEGKNRKPQTQEEADKAANFADKFQKIEKNAINGHKTEKEPILEAGRAIDTKWFVTRDAAVVAKKWARALSDEYVKAEQARRDEEARIANEKALREFNEAKLKANEQAKRDAELAARGVVIPQFAPPVQAPKAIVAEQVRIGTTGKKQSLRKVESYEIDDAGALLVFLASRNAKSENLLAAALTDGRNLQSGGVAVPGLKLVVKEEIR